jgi:hypothetical protein
MSLSAIVIPAPREPAQFRSSLITTHMPSIVGA